MSQRKQENKCVFKWKKTRKKCNEKKVIKADKNIKQELKFKRIMQRTRWKNTIEQEEYLRQENWWQKEKTNKNKKNWTERTLKNTNEQEKIKLTTKELSNYYKLIEQQWKK